MHGYTPTHIHISCYRRLLEDTRERKGKPNSHHTEKAFLRCASSCAHPGLASGWRPCCSLSTCMVSPAVSEKRPWIWVNAEPSFWRCTWEGVLPSSARCWQHIHSGVMNYFKFSGENRSTQNLLGSLKTTRWFTVPTLDCTTFLSMQSYLCKGRFCMIAVIDLFNPWTRCSPNFPDVRKESSLQILI